MQLLSLSDLVQAQRAFNTARLQATNSVGGKIDDAALATKVQHQALVEYLQTRTRLLTDARARALAEFDAEIANCQQKVGEVQQLLRQGGSVSVVPASGNVSSNVAPAKSADSDVLGKSPSRRKSS